MTPRQRSDPSDPARWLLELEVAERVVRRLRRGSLPPLDALVGTGQILQRIDRFYEHEVGDLQDRARAGWMAGQDVTAASLLQRVAERTSALNADLNALLRDYVLPQLQERGVRILAPEQWSEVLRWWAEAVFHDSIAPVVTPIAVDPAHPLPALASRQVHVLVELAGRDAFGGQSHVGLVGVPKGVPPLLEAPGGPGQHDFVTAASVLRAFASRLFPGRIVQRTVLLRVSRDLRPSGEPMGSKQRRARGRPVRLEVEATCPPDLVQWLQTALDLPDSAVFRVPEVLHLHRLTALAKAVQGPAG